MKRRTVLVWAGAIGTMAVAGCNDEEAPPDDGDDIDDIDDEDDDEIDDDDDDDDEIDDSDDTDDVDDEGDTDPDDDIADDEDEEDDDDDDDDDDEEDDSDDETDADADNPRLRDVLTWERSFEMELEFDEGTGHAVVYGEDSYATWTVEGETVEVYHVDGEWYTVIDDQCFRQVFETPDEDLIDPEEAAEDDEEYVATGTTTIEDEEVYEFEVEGGVLYVSVDTGYPVRFDGDDGGIATFHSWGETEPISPPDMECIDPEDGGSS